MTSVFMKSIFLSLSVKHLSPKPILMHLAFSAITKSQNFVVEWIIQILAITQNVEDTAKITQFYKRIENIRVAGHLRVAALFPFFKSSYIKMNDTDWILFYHGFSIRQERHGECRKEMKDETQTEHIHPVWTVLFCSCEGDKVDTFWNLSWSLKDIFMLWVAFFLSDIIYMLSNTSVCLLCESWTRQADRCWKEGDSLK